MALTRKLLEGMGIDEKQVETIIEAHTETVEALKAERDKARTEAARIPDLEKQVEELQVVSRSGGEWEAKYNEEHQAFEEFKGKVDEERTEAAKAGAYRNMLASAGIDPRRIDSIMRLVDLSKVEIEDGALKDSEALMERAREEWSDFVLKQQTFTATPPTPPKSEPTQSGADPDVAKRLQERHERLYGRKEGSE